MAVLGWHRVAGLEDPHQAASSRPPGRPQIYRPAAKLLTPRTNQTAGSPLRHPGAEERRILFHYWPAVWLTGGWFGHRHSIAEPGSGNQWEPLTDLQREDWAGIWFCTLAKFQELPSRAGAPQYLHQALLSRGPEELQLGDLSLNSPHTYMYVSNANETPDARGMKWCEPGFLLKCLS